MAKPALPSLPLTPPKGHRRAPARPPLCKWWWGALPVQEMWCRLRQAQVLLSSSTKPPASSHSCPGPRVQNIHKALGRKYPREGASVCAGSEGAGWHHTGPVVLLESQAGAAGDHREQRLRMVPSKVLKRVYTCPDMSLNNLILHVGFCGAGLLLSGDPLTPTPDQPTQVSGVGGGWAVWPSIPGSELAGSHLVSEDQVWPSVPGWSVQLCLDSH